MREPVKPVVKTFDFDEQWKEISEMSDFDFRKKLTAHRENVLKIIPYLKNEIPLDLFCTEDTIEDVSKERLFLFECILIRSFRTDTVGEIGGWSTIIANVMSVILDLYPDLFTAPASTMYHGDWVGGLMDHSLAVLEAAYASTNLYLDTPDKKIVELFPLWIVLHDLCKCNCYERVNKNRKNPDTGKWETVECYSTRKDYVSENHGAESVSRIYELLLASDKFKYALKCRLTECWRLAVCYHMGMYGLSDADMINYNNAKSKYPEVLLLHHADMVASQIWGF